MRDLPEAASQILAAIEAGKTILVHGDYDVDGVCATALLTLWLRRLGGRVVPFVPHRIRDGYDFGEAGIRAAVEAGAKLVVTCDSGILAHESVAAARAQGLEVIVTDHHTPGATLPTASAVLNPHRSDCNYPFPQLCGTGVAFKLCQELGAMRGLPDSELWPHLDLVALATIADLVPLTGENRTLVRFGLKYLSHTVKPGLQALFRAAGVPLGDPLEAGKVGFTLAPRINASGRMGDAADALRLLLSEDPREASDLAGFLEETNRTRQAEDRAILEQALSVLADDFNPERDFGVVLAGEGWHPGVIGIVASRVVERIHRPVVMVALDGEKGRGSARSIPPVHLMHALDPCAPHLLRYGGHRQAAGMDISRAALPAFRAAFNAGVRDQLGGAEPRPLLRAELRIPLSEATEELLAMLQYMGPFGMGNPRPVFWSGGLRVIGNSKVVGSDHLKLRLGDGVREVDAIGFGLAGRVSTGSLCGTVEALFRLQENEFRGARTLQAGLVDLRAAQ
jgi:single-stranded-DNA-specific exonuclease